VPDTVYACQHHIALVVSGKASGFLKEVSETAALTFGGMRTFLFFSSSLWLSAHGSVHSLFSFLFFTVAQCTHGSVHTWLSAQHGDDGCSASVSLSVLPQNRVGQNPVCTHRI